MLPLIPNVSGLVSNTGAKIKRAFDHELGVTPKEKTASETSLKDTLSKDYHEQLADAASYLFGSAFKSAFDDTHTF